MNPFERLRKTIDKVPSFNYEIENQQEVEANPNNNEEQYGMNTVGESNRQETISKLPNYNQQEQNQIILQQASYIKQINSLSTRNQRLLKQNKLLEIQKEQLLKEVCQHEKNEQLLALKIKELTSNMNSGSDKQRKYKEEIHRINSTLEQIGAQLTQERLNKKNIANQLNKLKEEQKNSKQKNAREIQSLNEIINKQQNEIEERCSMLQYNIKKNSDQKRQSKLMMDRLKIKTEESLSQIQKENLKLREQIGRLQTQNAVLNEKLMNFQQKYDKNCAQLQNKSSNIDRLLGSQKNIQQQLKACKINLDQLKNQNESISMDLEIERNKTKIKVVQIRDETLELQLQMYKRQCKDLLQQKILTGGKFSERIMAPEFALIQNPIIQDQD